ncbi:2-dehydropantoate 2-reductase [Marivibrio halodurans]|uniref:2-dehydropantoate 2-reductase n=1 Tax=Marivibrio halodurans TaxID=2039722 RepID=A0A8J7RZE6_9PROT|nr:2-dehydropantoate 2-reductase [Marivibrio halodurans]MBP5855868.1 2-dehydropantoate 2-reductase [Marivibrio halodurans]
MRITIFGAGAVGGTIAARLAAAGQSVSVVARGDTLAAIEANGLILAEDGTEITAPLTVTDDPATLPPQDVVLLGLKAHQIEPALPAIEPLLSARPLVVPAINGLPWWYFEGVADHPPGGARIDSVDPNGALARAFPATRLSGCVVYVAARTLAPGRVESSGYRRLILGPVLGTSPDGLEDFAATLANAGFEAPIDPDIRQAVWMKLWGNLWANPISVLTAAPMGPITDEPAVRATARRMMEEAQAVAARLGVVLDEDIEDRIDRPGKSLPDFRTSMLQDFDRGRPIELEAILGTVRELAHRLDIPAPTIDTVYGLTRLRARMAAEGNGDDVRPD